ncbi:MAG: hypothetical protein JXX28_12895 [Deltaproteobacteria bacterium]|nr:hypothetical protein [Deltaproteobacteria bacterium]
MKRTRISINGQDLSDVRTRAITDYPSGSCVSIGSPDVFVTEDGSALVVEIYPLTAAQLYFDGVLPQDRAIPVDVKVGRRKARGYLIDSMRRV